MKKSFEQVQNERIDRCGGPRFVNRSDAIQPDTTGIASSLLRFAVDEGATSALRMAEQWRNQLEQMAEVANPEQLAAIRLLLGPIEMHIAIAVEERKS